MIYQQIAHMITTSPGNILYHLVIAFSILGTTQVALNVWHQDSYPQARRVIIGLGLLLVSRLAIALAAVLSLNDFINPHILMPNVDRALLTINIIIILWLWIYPEPKRTADAASGLFVVLILIAFLLLQSWWTRNSLNNNFNDTFAATTWEILALVLLGAGILILIFRQPNGWGFGLAMMVTLSIGHLLQLIFPNATGDFPGAVRLFEMVAYPLLWTLPNRYSPTRVKKPFKFKRKDQWNGDHHSSVKTLTTTTEEVRGTFDLHLFRDTLLLIDETTPQTFEEKFTKLMAETMGADICLIILPPDDHGLLAIPCAYSLTQKSYLYQGSFQSQNIPLLMAAMKQKRPIRLPSSSTSKDTIHIAEVLDLERFAHLLIAFIPAINNELPVMGIMLVSSDPEHSWTRDDQAFLNNIGITVAPILQIKSNQVIQQNHNQTSREDSDSHQTSFDETLQVTESERGEVEEIKDQVDRWQDKEKDKLLASLSEAREDIDKLKKENLLLHRKITNLSTNLEKKEEEPRQLREELKLALTEIAQLRNQFIDKGINRLDDAFPSQMSSFQSSIQDSEKYAFIGKLLNEEQINGFTSVIQDLRQPMSSIVGYTDLLLSESAGILGAVQKKFVERIKISVQRMEAFVNNLIQIISDNTANTTIHPKNVNLEDAIDGAIAETQHQFQERGIVLRLDLADTIPKFKADQDALQQILVNLLKNACTATPINGEIFLRTSVYRGDDDREFVLIQVADQGGGILADDIPRVFSRIYRADSDAIPGIGESSIALSIVKTLVEAHNGRIWVDTELGKGSTITVLIPLEPGNNKPKEEAKEKGNHPG